MASNLGQAAIRAVFFWSRKYCRGGPAKRTICTSDVELLWASRYATTVGARAFALSGT